jgi:hypothetical protein
VFEFIYWKRLKKQLIATLICFVLSLLSVLGAYFYKDEQMQSVSIKQSQLNQAKRKLRDAESNQLILSEYYSQFQTLERKGVVGEEDRLNWIESFRKTINHYLIPKMSFEIEKRKKVNSSEFLLEAVGVELFRAEMALSFELLHEGDIMNFFQRVREEARGLVSIEECNIKRLKLDRTLSIESNLQGRCQLYWYTIDESELLM